MTGPWIRRKQIARMQGIPMPAELGEIVTKKGETLGWGLVSPSSAIAVRVLSFGPQRPPEDWLQQRLHTSMSAREAYGFEKVGTTGYRVVNSEGDGLPGLVIDRYTDDLVVQITTAPMAARKDAIVAWLHARGFERLHVVLPEAAAKFEGFEPGIHRDHDGSTLAFDEYGLRFETPAPPSQKTGAYFDQRGNRRVIAHLAKRHGGPLLDVGCHIGGFALHARRAGLEAVALDQSKPALHHARANAARNGLDGVRWVEADMFGPLDAPELAGPFGTIVLDPPKVATSKSNVDRATQALSRLAGRVSARLAPGGHLVLCSCSHHLGRDHLDRVMASGLQTWTRVHSLGAGTDHPVMPGHREGEYLRVNVYQRR